MFDLLITITAAGLIISTVSLWIVQRKFARDSRKLRDEYLRHINESTVEIDQ